jgi:predicted Zn-dependent protease with MMP-like domain
MDRDEFQQIVEKALEALPAGIQTKLENIAVVIEDYPGRDLLRQMGLQDPLDLLGLYQGIPVERRGFYYGNVLPDKVTLFRKPIENRSRSRREMVRIVQEVLLHELGHYFGFDDKELHDLLSTL